MEWILNSDPGDCRTENEDKLFAASARFGWQKTALFAVADGCGGMQRGAEASAAAIDCVRQFWETCVPNLANRLLGRQTAVNTGLEYLLQTAHAQVRALAEGENVHPASTLTVMLVIGKQFWIRHVGDCRVYRLPLTAAKLEQLTEDQSMVADMLRNQEIEPWEAADYSRSVLSMCLGVPTKLHTYANSGRIERGDIFLLCSDGLYAYAAEESIADQLRINAANSAALRRLIPPGRAGDNVSFIIAWEE